MRTDELDYHLPPERIATEPARPRDAARLMVIRRGGGPPEDRLVRDLPDLLQRGDTLVLNDTAVHPARLIGRKRGGGGRVEGLFLQAPEPGRWRVLLRGGRLRDGVVVDLDPPDVGEAGGAGQAGADDAGLAITLLHRDAEAWIVGVDGEPDAAAALDRVGRTPLPPYILAARRAAGLEVPDAADRADYQPVHAAPERAGSVAAPTAGLHFTPELFERLAAAGIDRRLLTLHVGEGTFRPVTADTLEGHRMHAEWCSVPPAVLEAIGRRGGDADHPGAPDAPRVIAVGTTSVRALESVPHPSPDPAAGAWAGWTDLLIQPGWRFRHLDGMLTNFHLPRSTLIALVAAMLGLERTLEAYRLAVERGYRFYSYGDAMLILP